MTKTSRCYAGINGDAEKGCKIMLDQTILDSIVNDNIEQGNENSVIKCSCSEMCKCVKGLKCIRDAVESLRA